MPLDPIWKQQLTLVSYANEYFAQQLSLDQWIQHHIFNQHQFEFRDLLSQHLLAQHFQVWLESLKQQGVERISLHHSSILNQEQNPNANVELLPKAHFIVSHHRNQKIAWIFGQELAEWYRAEEHYKFPPLQQSNVRHETFWRYELNAKLSKQIDQDLVQPDWDEIQNYTDYELFKTQYTQDFIEPDHQEQPYYGGLQATQTTASMPSEQYLALLPKRYPAEFAHQMLHRLEALALFLQRKISQPYDEHGEILSPEAQMNLRHFAQKNDEISAKFVVKVANHYTTAQLTAKPVLSALETAQSLNPKTSSPNDMQKPAAKVGKSSVFTLILFTLIICLCAYYFGL